MPRKPPTPKPLAAPTPAPTLISASSPDPRQLEIPTDDPRVPAFERAPFAGETTRTLQDIYGGTGRINPPGPALQPLPPMPLYQIDRELLELIALRDELEDSVGAKVAAGTLPLDVHAKVTYEEESKAIELRISQYMAAAREKCDAIAYTIRELQTRADIEKQESDRHARRSKTWQAQATRLKDYVLRFLTSGDAPIKQLKTPANTLRVQTNGGVVPLDIYDESAVPPVYRHYSLQCDWATFAKLMEWATVIEDAEVIALLVRTKGTPDADMLRTALTQRIVCPDCNGVLDVNTGCVRCGNTGTVPQEVPGARLLTRGQHLRVE